MKSVNVNAQPVGSASLRFCAALAVLTIALAILTGLSAGVSAQGSSPTPTASPMGLAPTPTPGATDNAGEEGASDEVDGCPALVQSAIDLTQQRCQIIGNNQVCYGHSELQAAARPGLSSFNFDVPGDIEDVITMQSLSLSAMNVAQEIWGVVLMRVQASLDVEDGGDVTFVVFGDTELQSRLPLVEAQANEDVRLRGGPSLDAAQLDIVLSGQTIIANGRSADSQWLRVRIPRNPIQNGWLFAELVTPDGDLESLDIIDPEADDPSVQYGPMQAFYFESGDEDAACGEAPNSGMLIQTPEGEASVTLFIDEVIIELDATAYLQAQPNGELTLYTLEGQARLTAMGETRTAVAGQQISVGLDDELRAATAPSEAEAYDLNDLQGLPTTLLPTEIEIAEPVVLGPGVPAPGNWAFSWGVTEQTCPDGTVFNFEQSGVPSALQVADDGATVLWGGGAYSRTTEGVYTRAYIDANSNLIQDTLTVNSADSISGESVIDVATTICTLTVPFSLNRAG